MKKFVALLFILIGLMVITLTGCSNTEVFTEKTYSTGDSEIEKVVIQVTDRDLEIGQSEDNQIYIEYFDGEKQKLDIEVLESKQLVVKLVFNKEWTDFIGGKPSKEYRSIKIKIPNNLIVALSASTTNENIKISSLSIIDNISLDSNGGNIVCEKVNVGKSINLNVKDGDITGSIIGGWDDFAISCKIKKGDCNLPLNKEGGNKSFNANCNNGDININFIKE